MGTFRTAAGCVPAFLQDKKGISEPEKQLGWFILLTQLNNAPAKHSLWNSPFGFPPLCGAEISFLFPACDFGEFPGGAPCSMALQGVP